MQTLFIASEDCKREFNRSRAHGYKSIKLSDGVAGADAVVVAEDGDKLIINKTEYCEGEEEVYIIACKSFGLVSRSLDTKVSVVFCDDDEMLVTLYSGAILVEVDGRLIMPSVGIAESDLPIVDMDGIYWVTAEHLLGYGKYMSLKGRYMYDFEFVFILSGELAPTSSFRFKHIEDETVDISGGYIAQLEYNAQLKQQMLHVNAVLHDVFGRTGTDDIEYSDMYDEDYDDEDEDLEEDYL